MNKQFKIMNTKSEEVDSRVIRFLGTDETKDRSGDVMSMQGWNIGNYMKNPIFLWAHNYTQPPIGKAVNVQYDNDKKGLTFDIKFADRDTYAFADTIYKLYKGGFLNAVSVGFIGQEIQPGENANVISKAELLELSAVPVPANPNALQMSMKKAVESEIINQQEYQELFETLKNYKVKEYYTEDELRKIGENAEKEKTNKDDIACLKDDVARHEECIKCHEKSIVDHEKKLNDLIEFLQPTKPDEDKSMKEFKSIYSGFLKRDKSKKELLSQADIESLKGAIPHKDK